MRSEKHGNAEQNGFHRVAILSIEDESKGIKTFFLDDKEKLPQPEPGQFTIVNIPGISANPVSFSYGNPLGITVRKFSDRDTEQPESRSFAAELFRMNIDDELSITAPKGRSIFEYTSKDRKKNLCLIAGGCGAAPLAYYLSRRLNSGFGQYGNVYVLLGAKTKDELLFEQRLRNKICSDYDELKIATDDGSCGYRGFVTDLIEPLNLGEKETRIIMCGPEKMMKTAAETAVSNNIAEPEDILVLMERYMKCGVGLCGSCACGGRLVCKDGPVIPYSELQHTEFGSLRRRKSGAFAEI